MSATGTAITDAARFDDYPKLSKLAIDRERFSHGQKLPVVCIDDNPKLVVTKADKYESHSTDALTKELCLLDRFAELTA